jgi:hypothetical protein
VAQPLLPVAFGGADEIVFNENNWAMLPGAVIEAMGSSGKKQTGFR